MSVIYYQTSDGKIIPADLKIAMRSGMIKTMLETLEVNIQGAINVPLVNVTSDTLIKVLEWAKHQEDLDSGDGSEDENPQPLKEVPQWDKLFLSKMNQAEVFDLIMAANYMEVKDLLDVSCMFVANMIKGKTPEEIRKTFNIMNDFSPEEQEQIRRENEWCEEK